MNGMRRNIVLLAAMLVASGLALALAPTHRIADDGKKVELESLIPANFGAWHQMKQSGQIVTAEQKETIARIYSQTLMRSYRNDAGEIVMLSIAYGADQSDDKQLHYPEVCYPAQGFQVLSRQNGIVKTAFGEIRVKRLFTSGGGRAEPLTYWSTVGNKVVVGSSETKFEQLSYGFRGQIPDGLLFRVSTIGNDTASAYAVQDRFVSDLMAGLDAPDRLKLAGLAARGPSATTVQ